MTEKKMYGYSAFLNHDKIRDVDSAIDIGNDDDNNSIAFSENVASPSIRATSPVISIASRYEPVKMPSSPPKNDDAYDNRSEKSARSARSAKSHKSEKSVVKNKESPSRSPNVNAPPSPAKSNSSFVLPPSCPQNSDAERLLKYQLERRRQKLYSHAERLQQRYGVRFTRQLNETMTIKELEEEIKLVRRNRKIDRNVEMVKRTLEFITKSIEWAADQSNIINLNGWSDELRRDLPEIGEILEELHEEHEEMIDQISNPWFKLGTLWIGGAVKIAGTNFITRKKASEKEFEEEINIDDPELDELIKQANEFK